MERKFLISYMYSTLSRGSGHGRIFVTLDPKQKMSQDYILSVEQHVMETERFAQVAVLNFVELES